MSRTRLPNSLFFAIALAALAQCAHDFPLLPDRVASHFGPSGMPNGWMTKSQFLTIYALMILPALAVEFWVARRIAKTPGARINMPNKEYWMAPERRASTIAYFESFFAWYGCAFLLLLASIMGMALRANLDPMPQLPTGPTVAAIGAFVLFNVVAIVAMYRRFSTRT
jgi:uncharacterized membrane protein